MISARTVEILSKLTKGAKKLGELELREFLKDIQSGSIDEILGVVLAPPPKSIKAKAEIPQWLKAMEASKKKISWKAPEAISQLYRVAIENGYSASGAQKQSFPAAAKEIAASLGEDAISEKFVAWVEDYVLAHQMV